VASVTCSQCGTSQPESKTCSACAEPLPRASRIRGAVEEKTPSKGVAAATGLGGDPFYENTSPLQIMTPWGDRVILEENDRMRIGRDSTSPWSRQMGPHISNRHAEVSLKSGILYITDLNSTNGTFVNDIRIAAQTAHQVNSGDVIKLSWDHPCILLIVSESV
jgi:hypothetical protein